MNRRLRECSPEAGDTSTRQRKRFCRFPNPSVGEHVYAPSTDCCCSHLEPLIQSAVKAAAQEVFYPFIKSMASCTCSKTFVNLPQREAARQFQLQFLGSLPQKLYALSPIKADGDSSVEIALLDTDSGKIVDSSPLSSIKIKVVAVHGDFCPDGKEDWPEEEFHNNVVHERNDRPPLLKGDLVVKLINGIGKLGEFSFTDSSHWTRSGRFKLGARALDNTSCKVREALTGPITVKSSRGKGNEKRHPPSLDDKVWRLEKIARGSDLHKNLMTNGINTVGDFMQILSKDEASLCKIIGKIPDKSWDKIMKHVQECCPVNKDNLEELASKNQNDMHGPNSTTLCVLGHKVSLSDSVGPHVLQMHEGPIRELQKEPSQLAEMPDLQFLVQPLIYPEDELPANATLYGDPFSTDHRLSIRDYGIYDDASPMEAGGCCSLQHLIDPFQDSQHISQASSLSSSWVMLLITIKCRRKFLAARKAAVPLQALPVEKTSGSISELQKGPSQVAEVMDMQSFHPVHQLHCPVDELFSGIADATPHNDLFSSGWDWPLYNSESIFPNETGGCSSFSQPSDPFEISPYISQVSSASRWVKLLTTIKCGRKFLAAKRKATVAALIC